MEAFKGRGRSGSVGSSILANSGFLFGTGAFTTCPADDTSFYCRFTRIFNMILMIITLAFITFLIYTFLKYGAGALTGGAKSPMKAMRRMINA
jgi:hypothetical protein